jgi:Rrf2 family protein
MTNARFAINIHILTLLTLVKGELLSSEYIAKSININPVLVRKELSNLHKAGFVLSKEGKNGGCTLAKAADQIYLSDIYKTVVEKPVLKFSKKEPNLDCPVGKQIHEHLNAIFQEAEIALLAKLGCTTLQQFVDKFN